MDAHLPGEKERAIRFSDGHQSRKSAKGIDESFCLHGFGGIGRQLEKYL
jgi:hypothetical protein